MPAGAKKPVRVPYMEHVPPETTAGIFFLKNREPREWRERIEATITDPAEAGRKSEQAERLIAVLQDLADKKSRGEAIPKLIELEPADRK
jgi:hypothetical protein